MSSRGPAVSGTDGTDYKHRQTVASHYQISVINKSRLSTCLLLQAFLFIALGAKLADDILDRLEIFILELQELYIPKPHFWEYVWAVSFAFCVLANAAMRYNSYSLMKIYIGMLISFSLAPVLYALYSYSPDVHIFYVTRDLKQVSESWKGYPTGVLWYVFLFLALQLHLAQLVFAYKLVSAWSIRTRSKKLN